MLRKGETGSLHFYINGLDQGVAATRVPSQMWGVVDLYGMTVKVTIVDRDERDEQNLITRRMQRSECRSGTTNTPTMTENQLSESQPESHVEGSIPSLPSNFVDTRLLFHPNCGSHAAVINNGFSAHRPNAADDFNFGVVLTNRPLKPNEVFEVRLDKMVTKWTGSIEIGVTTHSPNSLEFPSTMTNVSLMHIYLVRK
jgi:neuralized-like protein 4